MKRLTLTIACVLMMAGNMRAATIRVPADYGTVNAAIQAAETDDEIVISPGTYDGFSIGKKLTVRSTFDGKDWNIVNNTRIKGVVYVASWIDAPGPVIRGLKISFDPITTIPYTGIQAVGIICGNTQEATVEYCIIENCVHAPQQYGNPGPADGGAIINISGTIQNNIIRNNRADRGSAMFGCAGLIRNNLIYNDNGYMADVYLSGYMKFINNTLFSTTNAGISMPPQAPNINNIFWQGADAPFAIGNNIINPPRNCVIKGYTGAGINIITSDPKFVDPAKGDFHLQSTSPCIDAGLTTDTVKADIEGVQRGLKGVSSSATDIGVYEYKPKPVAVWLPNGGPDHIRAGDSVKVAWELVNPPAGTAITLKLYQGASPVATLGAFWNANGADESIVTIPRTLAAPNTYTIRGISNLNQTLYLNTPLMTIMGAYNAARSSFWTGYL